MAKAKLVWGHTLVLVAGLTAVLAACSSSEISTPTGSDAGAVVPPGPLPFGARCEDSADCESLGCVSVADGRAVCSGGCDDDAGCPRAANWACIRLPEDSRSICGCHSDSATEVCGDGLDNDCDGVVDCGEPSGMPDAGMSTLPDSGPRQDAGRNDAGECVGEDCEVDSCAVDPGVCAACIEASECDDGIACTVDACRARGCVHTPDSSLCDAAEICDPRADGCTAARACADDADCEDDDACTRAEHCDSSTAICRFVLLDGDGDEHLPPTCGGDDCDDLDPTSYPGALDVCDGADNDCNGSVDPPSAALRCADDRACVNARCECAAGLTACGGQCKTAADFQTDPRNCGTCGHDCGTGMLCVDAECEDIDECEDDPCGANATCSNFDHAYNCLCVDGYEPNGADCTDTDECWHGTHGCNDFLACTNTVGGNTCACPDGYDGTGYGPDSCTDHDECADLPDRCALPHQGCMNLPGTYACECEDGYEPSLGQCVAINECVQDTDGCESAPDACVNLDPGFECACPEGLIGDGIGATGCLRPIVSLAGGSGFNCALLDRGELKCWGHDFYAQLGQDENGSVGQAPEQIAAMPIVDLGQGRTAIGVTAGLWHACALLDDHSVKCWGSNAVGQLGRGNTAVISDTAGEMGDALTPINLGDGRTASAVVAGAFHTCALLDDGSVKCWGENTDGKLGIGTTDARGDGAGEMGDALPPVSLGSGRTAKQLAVGYTHTCALLDNDTVKCWGQGFYGQLGQNDGTTRGDAAGEMGDSLLPVSLGTGRTAKSIAAGSQHTCALLDNDTIKCWGYGLQGQLGRGNTSYVGDGAGEMGDNLPIVNLGTGRSAKAVALGQTHSCALLDNDTVKCWGQAQVGQLGQGNTTSRGDNAGEMGDNLPAIDLGTGRTAQAIVPGYYHTCALLDDDTAKCWGDNGAGELGIGAFDARGDNAGEMGDQLPRVDIGGL